ncbi:MAG: ABC transporter permease [Muribaculaceae bacterium]|nr:ABC transporter permease [Muribaculaceae bacterium]
MRVDFYIAGRLRLTDSKGNRARTSIRIATAGVVLSVVIMLITMAITSGFKNEIVNKLIGFDSQLTVEAQAFDVVSPQPYIEEADKVMELVRKQFPEAVVEESVRVPAMFKADNDFSAVVLRAYGGEGNAGFISDNIVEGKLPDATASPNSIIISSVVASRLGLHVGDKINTCFFSTEKMRLRNFEIAAIYDSGFGEYDRVVAYAPLSTLRKIADIPYGQAQAVEVTGLSTEKILQKQKALQEALQQAYYSRQLPQYLEVGSIIQTGAVYFNWLSLLDTNVVVILVLMTAISSFTLIASLIILILERVNMIGTLKMLGATNSVIRRIFILLDLKVLIKGLLLGNLLALALIFIQGCTHLLPLDPESYYIAFVPVKITVWQVVALNLGAVIVATVIMLLPSMIISRLKPASILRYE